MILQVQVAKTTASEETDSPLDLSSQNISSPQSRGVHRVCIYTLGIDVVHISLSGRNTRPPLSGYHGVPGTNGFEITTITKVSCAFDM